MSDVEFTQPANGERQAHPRHMLVKASLRDQHGSQEAEQQISERNVPQRCLDQNSDQC